MKKIINELLLCQEFSKSIRVYNDSKSYSMAADELERRYSQAISALKRYIIQQHSDEGVNEVIAENMYDKFTKEFVIQEKLGYGYIKPSRDSKLKELHTNCQKICDAYNDIMRTYFVYVNSGIRTAEYELKLFHNMGLLTNEIENILKKCIDSKNFIKNLEANEFMLYTEKAKQNKANNFDYACKIKNEFNEIGHLLRECNLLLYNKYYHYEKSNNNLKSFYVALASGCKENERDLKEFCEMINIPYVHTIARNKDEYSYEKIDELKANLNKPSSKIETNIKKANSNNTNTKSKTSTTSSTNKNKVTNSSNISSTDESQFKIENGILKKYLGKDQIIVIPNGVKKIGLSAFSKNKYIKHVTIPKGVKEIISYAFYNCINLEVVNMPNTVKKIKAYAFNGCSKLKTINLSNEIIEIESHAFADCITLESIIIPDKLKEIKTRTFSGCSNLSEVYFSDSLEEIEILAFDDCTNLKSVTIPRNCKIDSILGSFPESCKIKYK